ncbi:MAG: 3-isopropylmalate dehydratase small subunit, partial [Verrucomicrobiales bacterium]
DRIIPARFMKCITFEGLGEYAFYDVRYQQDGSLRPHPFNDPRHAGSPILVSGMNFGCGSSREHAPQALYRHGIRAIIAGSFAEIFFGNCTTLAMPCVTLDPADLARLAAAVEADPSLEVTIDVTAREVRFGSTTLPAGIPETARDALIHGRWDPIGELLEGEEAVADTAAVLPYLRS